MTSLVGDSLFAYSLTGQVPAPDGNFHPEMAPHGAYPCAGTEWLSIAVASDTEWQALCRILGPDLAADARFTTLASRIANRHALDEALGRVTCRHAAAPLAERLRQSGVPAFRCQSSLDLCSDEHLWGRGGFRMVSDHRTGSRPIIGPSWRMQPDEAKVERGAPLLGEDNAYVYREVLGLSQAELDDLTARKVID